MTFEEKVRAIAAMVPTGPADLFSPFDRELVSKMRVLMTSLADVKTQVTQAGYPALANLLDGIESDDVDALTNELELIIFGGPWTVNEAGQDVQDPEPRLLERFRIYGALATVENDFEDTIPEYRVAFSTVMRARVLVSAVEDVPSIIEEGPVPPPASAVPASPEFVNLCAPGEGGEMPTDGETPESQTVETALTQRVNQIVDALSEVTETIAAERDFFLKAELKLDQYNQALQIMDAFADFPLKIAIGSLGTDSLLEILKAPLD